MAFMDPFRKIRDTIVANAAAAKRQAEWNWPSQPPVNPVPFAHPSGYSLRDQRLPGGPVGSPPMPSQIAPTPASAATPPAATQPAQAAAPTATPGEPDVNEIPQPIYKPTPVKVGDRTFKASSPEYQDELNAIVNRSGLTPAMLQPQQRPTAPLSDQDRMAERGLPSGWAMSNATGFPLQAQGAPATPAGQAPRQGAMLDQVLANPAMLEAKRAYAARAPKTSGGQADLALVGAADAVLKQRAAAKAEADAKAAGDLAHQRKLEIVNAQGAPRVESARVRAQATVDAAKVRMQAQTTVQGMKNEHDALQGDLDRASREAISAGDNESAQKIAQMKIDAGNDLRAAQIKKFESDIAVNAEKIAAGGFGRDQINALMAQLKTTWPVLESVDENGVKTSKPNPAYEEIVNRLNGIVGLPPTGQPMGPPPMPSAPAAPTAPAGQPPMPPAGQPVTEGARAQMPDGRTIVLRGNAWVDEATGQPVK